MALATLLQPSYMFHHNQTDSGAQHGPMVNEHTTAVLLVVQMNMVLSGQNKLPTGLGLESACRTLRGP